MWDIRTGAVIPRTTAGAATWWHKHLLSYKPVQAILPDGSSFTTSRFSAAEMVKHRDAVWSDNYKSIRLNIGGAVRGLSCRIGEELARAYRQDKEKNGWAAAAVAQIRMQRESPSNA